LNLEDLELLAAEDRNKQMEKNRGKTAPARERRRNWLKESVDIKTARGERCKLKAPGTQHCLLLCFDEILFSCLLR